MCGAFVRFAIMSLLLAAPLCAQLQFEELSKRHLPNASRVPAGLAVITYAVAAGDVDGDGDVDLFLGRHGQNRLYANDGSGVFRDVTSARLPAVTQWTYAAALGDVDGDGDLDLVLGNLYTQNEMLLNDGAGGFTNVTAACMPGDTSNKGLALGDVDGDGDLDIVCGNGNSQPTRLYLNNGSGRFSDATATRLPADADETSAVALADVDGDGDLDLLIGNFRDQNRMYLNNGTGTFVDATASRLPADLDPTVSIVVADIDGDLDLDLAIANSNGDRLYVNDGQGAFADESFRLPSGRRSRSNHVASGRCWRSQVLFPVPRGPNRKNVSAGNGSSLGNIASISMVKMIAVYTADLDAAGRPGVTAAMRQRLEPLLPVLRGR